VKKQTTGLTALKRFLTALKRLKNDLKLVAVMIIEYFLKK